MHVDDARDDGEIDADEVPQRVDVVAADHEADVHDGRVLDAAHDRRRQRRVELRAEVDRVLQHRPEAARKQEVQEERRAIPELSVDACADVFNHRQQEQHDDEAKERIVVEQIHLRGALLRRKRLDIHAACRRREVVGEDKQVADEVEGQVVHGGDDGADHHAPHGALDVERRVGLAPKLLEQHRHGDGEAPQDREHGQADEFRPREAAEDVHEEQRRDGCDLPEGAHAQWGQLDVSKKLARLQRYARDGELRHCQEARRREAVRREHDLVRRSDHQGRDGVEERARELLPLAWLRLAAA
mmetsp:Transcript_9900/g.29106  ORF Transcript_9900/g.29106 Transcript_9900/m.29106 type:complete len:300 (+) Transcript_9900:270-1169(+)